MYSKLTLTHTSNVVNTTIVKSRPMTLNTTCAIVDSFVNKVTFSALALPNVAVFGGFVRDVILRGNPEFNDLDLLFPTREIRDQFVTLMGISYNVTVEHRASNGNSTATANAYAPTYLVKRIKISRTTEGPVQDLFVDCVTYEIFRSNQQECATAVDFTCNALMLANIQGQPHLCVHTHLPDTNYFVTFAKCIEDCKNHVFAAFAADTSLRNKSSKPRYVKYAVRVINRAQRLLDQGWTMRYDDMVPTFVLFTYDGHTAENRRIPCCVLTNEIKNESCCICKSDFSPGDQLLMTKCKHVMHKNCILEWMKSDIGKKQVSCPKCRHMYYIV